MKAITSILFLIIVLVEGSSIAESKFVDEKLQLKVIHFSTLMSSQNLRLLFVLATEHTLLRKFLNIWRQILLPGDLHDAAF